MGEELLERDRAVSNKHEQQETDKEGKQETAMVRIEHEQQETDGGRETRNSNGKGRT